VMLKVFMDNAETNDEDEKVLPFDKFSIVCLDYGLFTDEAQNRYIGIKNKYEI